MKHMKIVSPTLHGVLDYLTAAAMYAIPRQMGFSKQTTNLMTGAGAAILGLTALTRFPPGLIPLIPVRVHLAIDVVLDALLIREANRLGKKEPEARTVIMSLAISGLLLTLMTRSNDS